MAATSGLGAVTAGGNLAQDLLNHITPNSSTQATTITITGPIKARMVTSVSTNTTPGTTCSDANYADQAVTWAAASTTAGAGYGVGYVQKASSAGLTFGGGTGFAVAQTFTGVWYVSSDATPVQVAYENFAAGVVVPINNQYTVAAGSATIAL